MSLKKFISGVSAFAIAASAFAAMAVTASAKDYTDVTPTSGKTQNVTAKGNGVYTLTGTPGGVVVDFSDLEDIDKATSVTVDFDTKLPGDSSAIAKLMFGVGDKSDRGLTCGGSNNSGYNRNTGLVTFFGSPDGTHYYINQKGTTDYASAVKNKIVHATVTLNRETGAWTADYSVNGVTVKTSGTTDVDNITVVEAFAWQVPKAFDIGLANVKVSYTVPDAPEPVETTEAGFTYKTTIEKLTTGTVSLTIEATNGEETKTDTIDITDKLEGFAGDLMLAVVIDEIPEGITITSASISLD